MGTPRSWITRWRTTGSCSYTPRFRQREGQGVGTAIVEAALDLDEHPEAAERITLAES